MKFIIKRKWFVIVSWIAIVAVLFLTAPNMGDLVREKGQITIPEEYSSALAGKIMDEVQEDEGGGDDTTVALVFHNEKKLTKDEVNEAERAIRILEKNKQELGITEILTHFNQEDLESELVSKDGKSILTSITLNWNDREPEELKDLLYKTIDDVKVDHFYTSEWLINVDLINSSQEGVKKTEGITIAFILIVLILVFRSVVTPFIPLITVAFSYLLSQSVVAYLIKYLDFPVSTYTQIFLVVVLFGIGTDYSILLLSRFKEELAQRETVSDAILETYRNGGRTVLFSGATVMLGFATIGFSQFIIYQSAVAVAVGVAMLLIALFTILPFFMALLGPKLFWPSKSSGKHAENKIWSLAGRFSLSRPFLSLAVVAVFCVPFLLYYDGELSFDSMDEIRGDVGSVKAFDAISESFGPGEAMPTQIILKNDERMDDVEYLGLTEKISQEIEKVDLVDTVRSATRPTGEPIEDLLVSKQAQTLEEGLGEGKDGISQISGGLQEASSELSKSEPRLTEASEGINELINGTNGVKTGLTEIQRNLATIEKGMRQGTTGSAQIKKGLEEAKSGAEGLLEGYKELQGGYSSIQENLSNLTTGYQGVSEGLKQLSSGISQYHTSLFNYLDASYGELVNDHQYLEMKEMAKSFPGQINEMEAGISQLNSGLNLITKKMAEANTGFAQAINGNKELIDGLEALIKGIDQQLNGLNQLANGQSMIVENMPALTNGVGRINDGQKQLLDGFGGIDDQITLLTDGLDQSVDGLNQVSEGLGSARKYLSGLSNSNTSGFYLPQEVMDSKEFAQVLDKYMSGDRKVMTIDVIFKANPYSNKAMGQVDEIKEAVKKATKGTKLENAVLAVGGITSTNVDLDTMSSSDYSRTVTFMLIGIGIILMVLFRSVVMPLYIIGSLILTYFTTMAINEAIFVNILGYSGISWAVPFFSFVILIALGVDYSIFLMDRFNEYKGLLVEQAMFVAMKKMGTVIFSAAIILGGTFAAMIPSGMLSLVQIASITITGLLLYAFVVLPLFIPVMVKIFGEANWWPFQRPSADK